MRLTEVIPHPLFKISVYSMDMYYYVEIEGGPMKQCFKFNKDLAPAEKGGVKALLDSKFLDDLKHQFDMMHNTFKDAIQRNKGK